jgi:hypothetical protein
VIAGTVTIFVHGYNTSVDAARKRYEEHMSHLRRSVDRKLLDSVCWFYWPGERAASVPIVGQFLSAAAYPWIIGRARDSGVALALFLRERASPTLRVRLVAHSLGNRVVLETLKTLEELGPPVVNIDRIHLMAAAVPVTFCAPGGAFGARSATRRETVSFSGQDKVLGGAFPLGQLFETQALSQAVGRRGNPTARWASRYDSNIDHSDYWKDKATAQTTAYALSWSRQRPPRWRPPLRRTLARRLLAAARIID